MQREVCLFFIAFAAFTASVDADAQPLIERGRFGIVAGAAVFLPSAYQRALDAFGFSALSFGPALSAHWTTSFGRLAVVGARAGFVHTESSSARGVIAYNLADLSVVAGARFRTVPLRQSARVEFVAEVGPTLGDARLNQSPQFIATFRAAASVFIGADNLREGWYAGPRLSFAYVPWGGAGGSFFDPAFTHVHVGFEGGFL
jgi:hypothetical protein